MALRVILLIVSSLVLGAHFLRGGGMPLTLVCIGMPFLLLIKRPWVLVAVQIFTYLGSLLWLWTAYGLAMQRLEAGMPWIRMVVILIVVAAVTALSGALMNARSIKERYR